MREGEKSYFESYVVYTYIFCAYLRWEELKVFQSQTMTLEDCQIFLQNLWRLVHIYVRKQGKGNPLKSLIKYWFP